MGVTNENVAFVNLWKNPKNKNDYIFGIETLFQKIRNFFRQSPDFKKSQEKLIPEKIQEQALKLKESAKRIVLANKIGGGIVGIIPGVDWVLQRFVIKENAAKKIGMIFGIDINFINKEANSEEKKKQEEKKNSQNIPGIENDVYYDENALDLEVDASK